MNKIPADFPRLMAILYNSRIGISELSEGNALIYKTECGTDDVVAAFQILIEFFEDMFNKKIDVLDYEPIRQIGIDYENKILDLFFQICNFFTPLSSEINHLRICKDCRIIHTSILVFFLIVISKKNQRKKYLEEFTQVFKERFPADFETKESNKEIPLVIPAFSNVQRRMLLNFIQNYKPDFEQLKMLSKILNDFCEKEGPISDSQFQGLLYSFIETQFNNAQLSNKN